LLSDQQALFDLMNWVSLIIMSSAMHGQTIECGRHLHYRTERASDAKVNFGDIRR
jgi:hypothetical protein